MFDNKKKARLDFYIQRTMKEIFAKLCFVCLFVGFIACGSPIDQNTYNNLAKAVGIMKLSYCVGGNGIVTPQSTSLLCDDCKQYANLKLIKAWATTDQASYDTSGYLAQNDAERRLYLVFRGTKSVSDIITDITVQSQVWNDTKLLHECHDCRVHGGFLRSFQQTWVEMSAELLRAVNDHPDYQLHILGHSLGGATANLFAIQMNLLGVSQSRLMLITAGAPRAFNQEMANWVDVKFNHKGFWGSNRNLYRITHMNDMVPLVPNFMGYEPISGEIYIDFADVSPPVSNVYDCLGSADNQCSDSQSSRILRLLPQVADGHLRYFIHVNGCK